MKKLLYFFPVQASFVTTDFDILGKKFAVSSFYFKPFPKWSTPFRFITQFFFILFKFPRNGIMFSQFSGYHSFLPALLGKVFGISHYIVLNGTECNNFPEIHYGYIGRPFLFWFSKKSLQWSTRLFPVSEALVSAEYTYTKTKYTHQGYTNFYKKVNTPHTVIYNGVSTDRFNIDTSIIRALNSFITVASGLESHNRRVVKGLDLVIELAWKTPHYNYTFIGGKKPVDLELPANILVLDFIPHHQLSAIYNQHQFYLQLSLTEGFGLSVCEAMMSGCVPIVSDVGVLPFISSEKGYVLKEKNVTLLLELTERATSEYNQENINFYRKHVIDHFPLSFRTEKLLTAVG